MKAAFENDAERGRGYARLRLSEVATLSAGGWRFSLCRASDMTYLGQSGWQNSEDFAEPETYAVDGDDLVLRIGPKVVDRLDPNENYRITLQSDSQPPQAATFAIPTLNRTLMDAQGHLAAGAKQAAAPQPQPAPDSESEQAPGGAEAPSELPPLPVAPKKRPLPMILAALLAVLLLAGGGGAFWFMTKSRGAPELETPAPVQPEEKPESAKPEEQAESVKADAPEPAKPEEKPEPAQAAPPEPAQAAPPEPAQAAPPEPLSTRLQANKYLGANPTAQGARELAATLQQSSAEDQDALYRLWYFAAGEGDAAACLHLARTVDPALPAWGSIMKNGAEAWSLYAKSLPQHPEAAQAMQALKQWIETEAAKGNKDAEGWIRKIAEDAAKK